MTTLDNKIESLITQYTDTGLSKEQAIRKVEQLVNRSTQSAERKAKMLEALRTMSNRARGAAQRTGDFMRVNRRLKSRFYGWQAKRYNTRADGYNTKVQATKNNKGKAYRDELGKKLGMVSKMYNSKIQRAKKTVQSLEEEKRKANKAVYNMTNKKYNYTTRAKSARNLAEKFRKQRTRIPSYFTRKTT